MITSGDVTELLAEALPIGVDLLRPVDSVPTDLGVWLNSLLSRSDMRYFFIFSNMLVRRARAASAGLSFCDRDLPMFRTFLKV